MSPAKKDTTQGKTTAATKKQKEAAPTQIIVKPPKFKLLTCVLVGQTPYVQSRFPEKAKEAMMAKMEAGGQTRQSKRDPRDFDQDMQGAIHFSTEGWIGVPATAIRRACIEAGPIVGVKMPEIKRAMFPQSDGKDMVDGMPLIELISGDPERIETAVPNANGRMDIRIRALFREWKLNLRIKFDEEILSASSVYNLLLRAGLQVGIGEGRYMSKSNNNGGVGWGQFTLEPNFKETDMTGGQ